MQTPFGIVSWISPFRCFPHPCVRCARSLDQLAAVKSVDATPPYQVIISWLEVPPTFNSVR
jgi:hypothetical protein